MFGVNFSILQRNQQKFGAANKTLVCSRFPIYVIFKPQNSLNLQEQMNLFTNQRETLQSPTKTHTIPEKVLSDIRVKGLAPDVNVH